MFSVFVPSDSSLKKAVVDDLAAVPEHAVWIDLVNPTAAEDKAVERLSGIAIPTREDMQEIEISSRLYIENGARYMTATLMCQSDTDMPRTTAVTFILGRPSPGHGALRPAQAVCAGRGQAGPVLRAARSPARWC